MTASLAQRKMIDGQLPHELLKRLYLNSRISVKQLGDELGMSDHTAAKYLSAYEKQYGLTYTLDLDMSLLGFSEARLIAIKFESGVPETKLLKRVLEKEPFVQNAYAATGDFDLLLHVVASNHMDFNYWLYRIRFGFCRYKPRVRVSMLDNMLEGFLPIRPGLLEKSDRISPSEKRLLRELIVNSRARVKDMAKAAKISEMKVIYTMNKLKNKGVIKSFTSCIQKPEKRIFLFYMASLIANEDHHPKSLMRFLDRVISEEDQTEATNDYAVECEASGASDILFFCNFRDGSTMSERGPDFLAKAWKSESPIVERCILTDAIVGRWPFSKNGYVRWAKEMEVERRLSSAGLPVY